MEKNQTSCPKAVYEKIFRAFTSAPAFTTIRRISSRRQPPSPPNHPRNLSLSDSDPPIVKTKPKSLSKEESEVPIKFEYTNTTRLPFPPTEKPKPIAALNGSVRTNGQEPLARMTQQAKSPKPSTDMVRSGKPIVPGSGQQAQPHDDKFSVYIFQTKKRIMSHDQEYGENGPLVVALGHGGIGKDNQFPDYVDEANRKVRTIPSIKG